MFISFSLLLLVFVLSNGIFAQIFYTKIYQQMNGNVSECIILHEDSIQKEINGSFWDVEVTPAVHSPEDDFEKSSDQPKKSNIIEIFSADDFLIEEEIHKYCNETEELDYSPELSFRSGTANQPEVVELIHSGNPVNRIDVVFMGDGYTKEERSKFFLDIKRLTKDTLESDTFSSYLPLLNVWGIFVPSVSSGIGYTGKPKNTPFQLYRNPGTLRGIFTKNPKYARQICKLTGISACDYPSLIANDDYYGGLGGEFAISTSSLKAGAAVLSHEFGHNFAKVGEEYDNGEIYSGVNSSPSLKTLKWKSWLSYNLTTGPGSRNSPKEERMVYRILAYPQNDLEKRPLAFKFQSDGTYSRWYLFLTVSGAAEKESIEISLDGEKLHWQSHESDDKEFYYWESSSGFTKGRHNLTIRSKTTSLRSNKTIAGGIKITRSVGSVSLYEYGNENEFHSELDFISAYPTWDVRNRKTYRPTNAGCLMRNMSHKHLCSVCKEGIWLQFMRRVSLIDEILIGKESNPDGSKKVTLKVLKFGQFRTVGKATGSERLEIIWTKNSIEQVQFKDLIEIKATKGSWIVSVKLITLEVRNDVKGVLIDKLRFTI